MGCVMNEGSNSRPVVGAAVWADDLERIDGLPGFLMDSDRDVEIRDFYLVDALRTDWSQLVETVRGKLDGHRGRVGIHGPSKGFHLDTHDPDIRAIAQARLHAGLDACLAVTGSPGTGHMVVHSPYRTWDWHNLDRGPGERAKKIERVHETLREVVKRAEDEGVVIVIENVEDKDPHDRVVLARSFDSPAVKVSLDTGHAHYAHGATGAPPVDHYVRAAGAMLSHVHLQDGDGFADRHWQIGRGSIMWHSVFGALAELPEMPRLLLELKEAADLLPSAKWLAEVGLAD